MYKVQIICQVNSKCFAKDIWVGTITPGLFIKDKNFMFQMKEIVYNLETRKYICEVSHPRSGYHNSNYEKIIKDFNDSEWKEISQDEFWRSQR